MPWQYRMAVFAPVQVRKNESEAAIPELKQAVAPASNGDPADYYLLGVANQNTGHFKSAVVAGAHVHRCGTT